MTNASAMQSLELRWHMAAGDPIESFGRNGNATTPYPLYGVSLSQFVQTSDGKLLAGIRSQSYRSTLPGVPADFVRFNANGTADTTFGGIGAVDSLFSSVRAISVRSDGRFYALGLKSGVYFDDYNATGEWYVARFRPDGSLDRSFGARGSVRLNVADSRLYNPTLDTDGRVTFINVRSRKNSLFSDIVRTDASGNPDPTFGTNGVVSLYDGQGVSRFESSTFDIADDGSIVLAGTRFYRRRLTTSLLKLQPDGTIDTSFGSGGFAALPRYANSSEMNVTASADAVYVVGGFFDSTDFSEGLRLTRVSTDGVIDQRFNATGEVEWSGYLGSDPGAVLVQRDGKVIVNATSDTRRYNIDGSPDETFGRISAGAGKFILGRDDVIYSLTDSNTITAIATTGTSPGPAAIDSAGNLTLIGTGYNDRLRLHVGSEPLEDELTIITAYRGNWGRFFALDDVKSVRIEGGSGDDDINGDTPYGVPATISGGRGNDRVENSRHRATISGGDGNDTIQSLAGGDWIEAGAGDDDVTTALYEFQARPIPVTRVYGGSGNDRIYDWWTQPGYGGHVKVSQIFYGQEGNDTLNGGAGRDYLDGGPGDDSIIGGGDRDTLIAGGGTDVLVRDDYDV